MKQISVFNGFSNDYSVISILYLDWKIPSESPIFFYVKLIYTIELLHIVYISNNWKPLRKYD